MYEFQFRLEKFQCNEIIDDDGQLQIVNAVNQFMAGKNVFILRDEGNKSWLCLHYRYAEEESAQKIAVFIPSNRFDWTKFIRSENYEKINGWLPPILYNVENPAEIFRLERCTTSDDACDQLLLTLVYAFGSCLNFRGCYLEPFGQNKENIRRTIFKSLMDHQMPTIEEMWGAHAQPPNESQMLNKNVLPSCL